MWQQYRSRLPSGSRVKEEASVRKQGTGGGCHVAAGYRRRPLCGNKVQEEVPMWQPSIGGGGYVEAG